MRRRFHFVAGVAPPPPPAVSLPTNISIADEMSGGAANASITFNADGTYTGAGSSSTSGNWYTPTTGGVGSAYEVRYTLSSGSVTTGTTGTWLAFPQSWSRNRLTPGFSDASGTLEIRLISSGVVQASTTLTLTAERV